MKHLLARGAAVMAGAGFLVAASGALARQPASPTPTATSATATAPASSVPSAAGESADAAYAGVAKRYFYDNFAHQPIAATLAGVHEYDDALGSYAAEDFASQLARDRATLAELASIDPAALSPEVRIDRQMLQNSLRDDLLINGRLAVWRHNPDTFVGLASSSIFAIVSRAYAPGAVRLEHAIHRERQLPRLFAQAEADLTTVDATTAELAEDDAKGTISFFRTTVPLAFAGIGDARERRDFARANAEAIAATTAFAKWIATHPLAHPAGTYAIGADAYRLRLKYEEGLDIPLERYLAVGERALAATKAQFVATARAIDPHASPQAVQASLFAVHPSASNLLAVAARDLVALRAFVVAKHIVTLPADANIEVVETPEFERQTTFASMDSPGALETVATQAYYNVTPVDPAWSAKRRDEFLGFFNDYYRPIVSAHEVYPGHYVNYTIDKRLPLSLTRKLLWTSSFGEGWAHYDEQMIVDEGWGHGDPRVRLAQLGGALIRECRFIVGVREHTQGMTVAQATQFFVDNGFMGREPASHEALRGTQDATYGYYTLGKLEILKLRDDMRKKLGPAFTLQRFHDELLAHGDPPIPLLRPLLLGADDDGKVL